MAFLDILIFIIRGIQFDQFARHDEDDAFANICHPVSRSLKVMDNPKDLVGMVDFIWMFDHILDDLAVDSDIQLIYLIIFFRDGVSSRKVFRNKSAQRAVEHGGGFICHGRDFTNWDWCPVISQASRPLAIPLA